MTARWTLGICFAILLTASPLRAQQLEPRVRLADLEAEVERVHPAIQAAAKMAEAKRARIAQARGWPDPQLSLGYMGDPAPFKTQAGDPSSYRQLGVMQEIPYPGKRDLRGRVAEKEAEAETWNIETARRRILAELRQAFYEMQGVDRALEITLKNKDLLEKLARIAEERYKVGQGLQQDVLRAQVEITRVAQRMIVLRQRRQTLEAQLNSLLRRPLESSIGALEPAAKTPLTYSLDELVQRAVETHPEVRRQEQVAEQNRLAADLARREFYPDFGIGWDYLNRPGMPEMYGLRFTVNLPIFNKRQRRAAVEEANAMQASARHMREAVRTELFFQVKEQYLAARTSEELLDLYAKGLVPQSTLALESGLAAYQVGKLDFLNILSTFATLLDYEMSYYDELANHQKALARLEEMTGIPLVAGAASAPAPAAEK